MTRVLGKRDEKKVDVQIYPQYRRKKTILHRTRIFQRGQDAEGRKLGMSVPELCIGRRFLYLLQKREVEWRYIWVRTRDQMFETMLSESNQWCEVTPLVDRVLKKKKGETQWLEGEPITMANYPPSVMGSSFTIVFISFVQVEGGSRSWKLGRIPSDRVDMGIVPAAPRNMSWSTLWLNPRQHLEAMPTLVRGWNILMHSVQFIFPHY